MASPKSTFPGSGKNNENYSSQDQMISNFQNQMKKAEKHFTAPTVSAASKVKPKKKVLVERNENSRSSYVESSDDGNTNLCGSFRLKPYDSLTNYLSPRPKFLRFDPNRRREILNRLEKEPKEELSCSLEFLKLGDEKSSSDDKDSYISHVTESVTNQEIVGNDSEEDEEEEEFEEERRWCLKGVLKILLALVACFLSTSYICSMNSSMHLPSQQAVWDFKDGYVIVQNQTLESIDDRVLETGFLVMKEIDSYLESGEVGIEENGNAENKEQIVEEAVEDGEVELDGQNEELVAINENIVDEIDEAVENTKNGESKEDGAYMMENEGAASHYGSIGNDADIIEPAEKSDEVFGDDEFESENETQETGSENFTLLEEVDSRILNSAQEEVPNQLRELDGMELFDDRTESLEKSDNLVHEVDDEMEEQENEMESAKTGRSRLFVIGLSVLSIILTSLAFFYRSEKVKITSAQESKPVEKELTPEPLAMERKITSDEESQPGKDKLTPEPLVMERKIEFLAPTLKKEASGSNNNNIHVPTVELLGEIVIGDTRSNSFRSVGRKDDMISPTLFREKGLLPQPLSDPQESFTAEMKNLKKQGKAAIEVTPVRRSGRLRNRAAVMSP